MDARARKWSRHVMARLIDHPHTFGELLDAFPTLSARVLTDTLRALEDAGLVDRRPDPIGRTWYALARPQG